MALISELGRRIVVATGDPRSTAFLRQRINDSLQRGNAASVMGTLVEVSLSAIKRCWCSFFRLLP